METTLADQYVVLEKYRALCETALDAKLPGLNGVELFVLSGAILDDPLYSERYTSLVAAWLEEKSKEYGENFAITPERFALETEQDFPQQVVKAFTRDERLALRARMQAAKKLPRG